MNRLQLTNSPFYFLQNPALPKKTTARAGWLTLLLCLLAMAPLSAKVTTSVANGSWSAPATWNNGVPADGDQVVISAAHIVTLTANVSFPLAGSTLTVNGTLNLATFTCFVQTVTVAAAATVIQNTSSGAAVPANLTAVTLSLNAASTYSYTGNQTGFSGAHPIYGHLSYASSAAGAGVFEVNLNVAGNLTINNSGAGEIRFANASNRTHSIGGNLTISGGNVAGSAGAANVAIDVNGNVTIFAGTSFKGCGSTGNATVNIAGNFAQNGTLSSPGSGSFTLIFDGSGNSTISGLLALTVQRITINKSGGALASLSQHLGIGVNLTFLAGKLQIGNFNLTLATGAAITGASNTTGFVETNGTGKLIVPVNNIAANFPVGILSYTPVTIVPTFGSGSFGVRVVNGFSAEIPGCSGFVTDDAVKKMWIVTRESGAVFISEIYLNWNGTDEGSSFNRALCGVVRYLSGNWEAPAVNTATGSDPYQRGRLFGLGSTVFDGTFGVLDNSASVNLSAPLAAASTPLCVGQTLTLQLTSPPVNGATYQWSKQGGGFTPPAGPNASIPNVQLSDAGNYLLTMSKYGCDYTSTAVAVVINPPPVCSIAGPVTVCSNTTGHVYTAPGGMASYGWTILGNGSIVGSSNGSSVSVDAGAAGAYSLSLNIKDANGCTSACTLQVTVLARPTGVLSGSTAICEEESATLSIAVTGQGPWNGTLSDGTPFSGNSSPIQVSVSPAGTTVYTISSLSDANCTATPGDLSGSASVTVQVLQMFEMTGGGAYCTGGDGVSVGLSGSEPGVNYQLFVDNGSIGSPVAGTGNALDFGLQTIPGTYTVVATHVGLGCEKEMTGSVAVTLLPLPSVSLELGDDDASVTETSVALTGGMPAGGTYSGPGVSGGAIDPSEAGVGQHTITYTYTDGNGCSGSATDTFTVYPVDGLNLSLDAPDSAACGEKFTVDIVAVAGFTDLGTLQFSVGWDLDQLMLMGDSAVVIDGTAPLTGVIGDTLVYSWLDENDSPYGVTLPDNSLLLRLTFKALAGCGNTGTLSITNRPRVIEASDLDLGVVPVTLLGNNEIAVYDTEAPYFDDFATDVTVECGEIPLPSDPPVFDNCDPQVEVTYLGEQTEPGACAGEFTITRSWQAVDDCENSTVISQVLHVEDSTPPSFTLPADATVYLNEDCQYDASPDITGFPSDLSDNCTPPNDLIPSWSDEIIPVGNGQQVVINRTWSLLDACGNAASTQIQVIAVQDDIPPQINCPASITVNAGGTNCTYTALGGALDPDFSDNCGIADTTWLIGGATAGSGSGSLDGTEFNQGTTSILWTVTDRHGNSAQCSFQITVNECVGITGRLIWEGDDVSGVAQATVTLSGDASDTDGPTDGTGQYLLNGAGANLVITPLKPAPPAAPLNGVTVTDALIVRNHVLGTMLITDPYKLLAADINLSNIITSTDASIIRQAVLGSGTALEFFLVKPWRFVPTPDPGPGFPGYIPPANPFSAPIPENRTLTGVAGPLTNQNFFGIKMGDVDATANPLLHPADALVWTTPDKTLNAGQELLVTFYASRFQNLAAYQFALHFDPAQLRFLDALPVDNALYLSVSENFGAYAADEGELRSAWIDPAGKTLPEGSAAFTLRFEALQSGARLSEVLQLSEKNIPAEACTPALWKTGVQLAFTEATATAEPGGKPAALLLQNRPNPFGDATAIGFVLPEACEARLRVTDAAGRELWRVEKAYARGYQEEIVRLGPASAGGVLYYELTTPFGQTARRMVRVQP